MKCLLHLSDKMEFSLCTEYHTFQCWDAKVSEKNDSLLPRLESPSDQCSWPLLGLPERQWLREQTARADEGRTGELDFLYFPHTWRNLEWASDIVRTVYIKGFVSPIRNEDST